MNEGADADYQRACIDAARSLATMPLDGQDNGGGSIDAQTRDAARAFLRAEFARWTDEGESNGDQGQAGQNGESELA